MSDSPIQVNTRADRVASLAAFALGLAAGAAALLIR